MLKKYSAVVLSFLLIGASNFDFSWFHMLDNRLLDSFFKIRGTCEMPQDVLFVYLDEQDIQSLGGWPLTRDYWAYAIHQATDAGARAVAIDVLFSTENQLYHEFDQSLVEIAAAGKNLILPLVIDILPRGDSLLIGEIAAPFSALRKAARAIGFANLGNQPTVREVPVMVANDSLQFYSFGIEIARALSGRTGEEFNALLPESEKIRVNFAGYSMTKYGMSFVLFLQTLRTNPGSLDLAGKFVLIAPVAPGLPIVRQTPFAPAVPAALIHLNVAENIVQQNYLCTLPWLFVAIIMAILCALAWALSTTALRKYWYFYLPATIIVYLIAAFLAFALLFTVVPVFYPLCAFGVLFFVNFWVAEKLLQKELNDRAAVLKSEISRTQQQVAAAETALFELRKQQLVEQQKSSVLSWENENKLLAQQKKVIALEKQLRDLQVCEENKIVDSVPVRIASIIHAADSPLTAVINMVQKVAADDIPVLISGETGTGKEVIARAIHAQSRRKSKPFIAVNCGALPESLLESELFGHEKGAFTGAQSLRRGRFELADGGTIFLDEISETSPAFQARLLRVLQEGSIERLGSERSIRIDVRCIAASNQDIKKLVDAVKFRADLYYRLNGFPITIPPLRQRQEDIPLLARHFLAKYEYAHLKISKAALDNLCFYNWPGNVRELENTVRRMGLLATGEDKNIVQQEHLPEEVLTFFAPANYEAEYKSLEEQILTALRKFEFSRSAISRTARFLGNKDRGTITEYYRGLCFQYFVENEFDVGKTAAALAATSDAEILQRVQKKLQAYLANLDPAQKEPGHPQYKGLPKKFHPALDVVLDFLAKNYDRR